MISSNQITIIIQGPFLEKITNKVIKYTLLKFPKSKIIFSTWKSKKINTFKNKKVKLIKNLDPGAKKYCDNPNLFYSYQRQVKSTLIGLKKAKTEYCMKLRSDCIISNKEFLKTFDKYPKKADEFNILKKRVIISSHYTMDPRKFDLPFHYSDWFFFGLKNDLLKIFNQNYLSKENNLVADWFKKNKKPSNYHSNYYCRFRVEQNIIRNFLKKYIKISFNDGYYNSKKNIFLTEKILSNNFIVLDPNFLGLYSYKNKLFDRNSDVLYFNGLISNKNWQYIYKKYCNKSHKIQRPSIKILLKTFLWIIINFKQAIYRSLIFNNILKHK